VVKCAKQDMTSKFALLHRLISGEIELLEAKGLMDGLQRNGGENGEG